MNNPQTENDNIIRSVKPGFEYPNVSVAEFIAQKVATHDPSTPAIVSLKIFDFLKNKIKFLGKPSG